jgi:P27 family predicted phage terminase small subunit
MRGRLPGSAQIAVLGDGARKHGDVERPAGTPVAPEPPTYLRAIAKDTWTRLAPGLYEDGLLTDRDLDMFEAYCNAKADLVRYQELLDAKQEHTTLTPNKASMQIPEVGMRNRALAQLQKLGEPFGLNPLMRQRMRKGAKPRRSKPKRPSLLTQKAG